MQKFRIDIPNFMGGFAPAWYLNTYPSYGNKNMAGNMQNADLTDPAGITQGPGLVALTNGTTAGVVNSLMRGILDEAISSNVSYGVGGAYVYKLASASVISTTAAPESPHGISGTGVALEDVAYYRSCVYYSRNTAASAQVGRLTGNTFDDDWATVSGSASISAGGPLPLEAAGNDMLYLGNKNRVSSWDGASEAWTNADLDLPLNCEVQDVKWHNNRLWIAVNRPSLTGNHRVGGSIYVWDGNSESWEDELKIGGKVGGMFINNSVLYLFYQDVTHTGGYKLGFLNGAQVQDLCSFTGSLPQYYQVTKYKNFIIWPSGELIYAFGAMDKNLPSMLFQLCDGGFSTVGGIAAPFGTPYIASSQTTSYQIAKLSGYEKSANWKSMMFPIGKAIIEKMKVYFDTITTGARCDFTINADRGKSSYSTSGMRIDATTDTSLRIKDMKLGIPVNNDFRVEASWANGSTANPVKINRIEILGTISDD